MPCLKDLSSQGEVKGFGKGRSGLGRGQERVKKGLGRGYEGVRKGLGTRLGRG